MRHVLIAIGTGLLVVSAGCSDGNTPVAPLPPANGGSGSSSQAVDPPEPEPKVPEAVDPLTEDVPTEIPAVQMTDAERALCLVYVGDTMPDANLPDTEGADQSLAMLADPSPAEQEILSAIPYQANEIVLHTDAHLLPRRRRAWASWNYYMSGSEEQTVTLTYNLNRLQGHRSNEPILETLNPAFPIDPAKVLDRMTYDHPVYSVPAIDVQRRYHEINGQRNTYYCGAYWGYGFHEDGVRSALAVGECFGKSLESCIVAST